jgi:Methyltransferase domain
MRWQLKFAKNALFGILPFSGPLRAIKRSLVPYPTSVPEWTLEQGFQQIEILREIGCDPRGKTLLEIGTGWQPLLPMLFYLAGCQRQILVDTQRLMDQRTFFETVANIAGRASQIASRLKLNEDEIRQRLKHPQTSFADALRHFSFDYRAPYDLTAQPLPDHSVDIITSRAVMEHVPPPVLKEIFARTRPTLKKGGVSCPPPTNPDHWSHHNRRLSRVNFLRYEDRTFDLLCRFNPLDFQNRLRHSEYLALLRGLGYKIVYERADIDQPALQGLASLPLAGRFKTMPHDDLAKVDSYIVAAVDE